MSIIANTEDINWNYRKLDERLVRIKATNVRDSKAVAVDVLTNIPITFDFSKDIQLEFLEL